MLALRDGEAGVFGRDEIEGQGDKKAARRVGGIRFSLKVSGDMEPCDKLCLLWLERKFPSLVLLLRTLDVRLLIEIEELGERVRLLPNKSGTDDVRCKSGVRILKVGRLDLDLLDLGRARLGDKYSCEVELKRSDVVE